MKALIVLAAAFALSACTTAGRVDWKKTAVITSAVVVGGLIISNSGIGNHNEHEQQPCTNPQHTCH